MKPDLSLLPIDELVKASRIHLEVLPDPASLYQDMADRATGLYFQVSADTAFLTPEIAAIPEETLAAWLVFSLLVPMACEQHQVPCDFYVKTFHSDQYPSATPKALRKEFMWQDGGEGWYDNMWCINAEETIAFMKTVTKPWLAFKVLAAGAFDPKQAFPYAFQSGADFIAVGMFDFQVTGNCTLVQRLLKRKEDRSRPWLA